MLPSPVLLFEFLDVVYGSLNLQMVVASQRGAENVRNRAGGRGASKGGRRRDGSRGGRGEEEEEGAAVDERHLKVVLISHPLHSFPLVHSHGHDPGPKQGCRVHLFSSP